MKYQKFSYFFLNFSSNLTQFIFCRQIQVRSDNDTILHGLLWILIKCRQCWYTICKGSALWCLRFTFITFTVSTVKGLHGNISKWTKEGSTHFHLWVLNFFSTEQVICKPFFQGQGSCKSFITPSHFQFWPNLVHLWIHPTFIPCNWNSNVWLYGQVYFFVYCEHLCVPKRRNIHHYYINWFENLTCIEIFC